MAAIPNYLPVVPIARAVSQYIIPDLSTIVGEYARSSSYEVFYALDWSCRLSEYFRVKKDGSRLCAVDPGNVEHVQKHQVRLTIGKSFDRESYSRVHKNELLLCAVNPNDARCRQELRAQHLITELSNRGKYQSYNIWISADLDSGYFGSPGVQFGINDLRDAIMHRVVRTTEHAQILIFSDALLSRLRAAILDYE